MSTPLLPPSDTPSPPFTRKSVFLFIGAVAAVILLVAGMLVGGYFLTIRTSNSAASAQAIAVTVQTNQRELCKVANQENAKQILLWEYILHLTPPKTPEQQKLDQQFNAFLNQVFRALPCPH